MVYEVRVGVRRILRFEGARGGFLMEESVGECSLDDMKFGGR